MAIYVDQAIWPWRGKLWAHLMADDLAELHSFGAKLGMRREWFQAKRGGAAHYDITSRKREFAIKLGAIALDRPTDSEKLKLVIANARAQLRGPKA